MGKKEGVAEAFSGRLAPDEAAVRAEKPGSDDHSLKFFEGTCCQQKKPLPPPQQHRRRMIQIMSPPHPLLHPSPHPRPKKPLPPPQKHRRRMIQIILPPPHPLPPVVQPQSQPQFVAATSLISVPPYMFHYNVSYDLRPAYVSTVYTETVFYFVTTQPCEDSGRIVVLF